MEASSQDAIFYWEIEVITKEAFLENITVANRHLSLAIENPSFPSYIQGKINEAIDLLHVDEELCILFCTCDKFCKIYNFSFHFLLLILEVISGQPLFLDSNMKIRNTALLHKRKRPKNKKVLKNKKTFIEAPKTSSGLESNIITANNPGIANITQTVSNDQLVDIPESHSNPIHNPDSQAPQSLTNIQISSQGKTSNHISHQPTNSNTPSDPVNIPSNLTVGHLTSNSIPLNNFNISDLTINNAVTKSTNT
ncbi:hypothetical protein BY996DRAFT_6411918 [Phakopsora pachyrhizi]|nr:hypothetical protein BY996DRAFT_6412491 [Phakopsora pachyrhizi]KAI8457056.1 hypothetical protein BY996DRAFT_6411918 [Phakopsora pachyrhizi]